MKLVFVSHCALSRNSGIHVASLARELARNGSHHVLVLVPENCGDDEVLLSCGVSVVTYLPDFPATAVRDFGADVCIAFTPRGHVVEAAALVAVLSECPYVCHFEDDEASIVEADTSMPMGLMKSLPRTLFGHTVSDWRTSPWFSGPFLRQASGFTGLVDGLRGRVPASKPWLTIPAGAEDRFFAPPRANSTPRRLDFDDGTAVVAYTGSVHSVNIRDFLDLVDAVGLLRLDGRDIVIVKSGHDSLDWSSGQSSQFDYVYDMGFCSREDVHQLIAHADVLAQPGADCDFNRHRFPSKIPEYCAMGKPVVVARVFAEALNSPDDVFCLAESGSPRSLAESIERVLSSREFATALGAKARAYAEQTFVWARIAQRLEEWLLNHIVAAGHVEGIGGSRRHTSRVHLTSDDTEPLVIAFYLTQFHAIPENDAWWGTGFTEWTNVNSAQEQFSGHGIPRSPAPYLPQYDLTDFDVMVRQAALASAFGIGGFCYYYYWFNGKRLLEAPLDNFISSQSPDFPFVLCWANENWTRRWDGRDQDVLMAQTYESGWVEQWFADVLPILQDSRCIHIDGKPMLIVYNVAEIPDPKSVVATWKALAREAGLAGLHVAGVQHIGLPAEWPILNGCDATVEFPPHLSPDERELLNPAEIVGMNPYFEGYVEDYWTTAQAFMKRTTTMGPWYRGVMPSWDNTPRMGRRSHIYLNSSPDRYEAWLTYSLDYARSAPHGGPIVFINAWNEWAEGAVLEPNDIWGFSYLAATSRAIQGFAPVGDWVTDGWRRGESSKKHAN